MNPLRQLFRRPVATVAIILVLTMASAFLSLSAGVYVSSEATQNHIENAFTTIAMPNSSMVSTVNKETNTVSYEPMLTFEMWDSILSLPETNPGIKGTSQQTFISAWSPSFATSTSTRVESKYTPSMDMPYYGAVFAVSITDIQKEEEFLCWYITAEVEETLALHPDYTPWDTLRITYCFATQEEMEATKLEVGDRYLVYGRDYIDSDLQLRTELADRRKTSVSEIDWKNISFDVKEFGLDTDSESVAVYLYDDGGATTLYQSDMDRIQAGEIIVDDRSLWVQNPESNYSYKIDGTEGELLAALEKNPTFTHLEGRAEDFLNTEAGAEWKTAIQEINIRNQSVPVLGTDKLESIFLFQQKEARIVDGRSFSETDYLKGNRVCILSETLANSSDLSVGDTVDIRYYWGASPYAEMGRTRMDGGDPAAQIYRESVGFSGEASTYEIIGIYRQANLWANHSLDFTPNTVFVPNSAIGQIGYSDNGGLYYSLILKNGHIDEVQSVIDELGYPKDTLLYYDGGYAAIADTLKTYGESTLQLFLASCATWLAVLAAYLILFVRGQRKTAGLMRSLGTEIGRTRRFVWKISMLPASFSALLGGILGVVLHNRFSGNLFSSLEDQMGMAFSSGVLSGYSGAENTLVALPYAALMAGIVQIVLMAAAIWLLANSMAHKKPLVLIKGK